MTDWEPLESALMNMRYRHALGLPFGPLPENETADLEDVLTSHIEYMRRVIYGDMTGPMAPVLLANLKTELETQGVPLVRIGPDEGFDFEPVETPPPTVFDKAAAERVQYLGISPRDALVSGLEAAGLVNMDEMLNYRLPDVEEGEFTSNVEWLSLPKHTIPDKAREFCRLVESGATKDWCQCLWEVHRDHAHIPENHCVICQEPREAAQHHGGPVLTPSDVEEGYHSFRGRGLRLKETRISCPVHVKEGLILGFFEWVFKDAEDVPSTDDAPGKPPATGDGEIPGGALPTDIPGSE